MDFIDLFAGIGGFHLAAKKHGHTCVFASEIDKFARQTYAVNHGMMPHGDIKTIASEDIPAHDILFAGFPCPAFSKAGISSRAHYGYKTGLKDTEHGGTMFYQILRIADYHKPEYLILENVANLITHDKGRTFKIIQRELEAIGYSVQWREVDGLLCVPQRRKRVFMVCTRTQPYLFPLFQLSRHVLFTDILEDTTDYTISDKWWNALKAHRTRHSLKGNGFGYVIIPPVENAIAPTLTKSYGSGNNGLIYQPYRNPRMYTPRECARLMGYPDSFKIPVSRTQAYKQFGNSIIVPIAETIIKEIDKWRIQNLET